MSEKTYYWSRVPGKFVNKNTGEAVLLTLTEGGKPVGPAFTGSVREWYETLVETLIDMRNHLHREAGTNSRQIKVHVSPLIRTLLECSVLYKPRLDPKDGPKSQIGSLCGMDVFVSGKVQETEIEVEFVTRTATKRGKVAVLDINII